jgi:hypothetical protein
LTKQFEVIELDPQTYSNLRVWSTTARKKAGSRMTISILKDTGSIPPNINLSLPPYVSPRSYRPA